jgi:hypothetical protein
MFEVTHSEASAWQLLFNGLIVLALSSVIAIAVALVISYYLPTMLVAVVTFVIANAFSIVLLYSSLYARN